MTTLQLRFLHKSVPSFPMSPTSADDPGESKLKALKPRLQGSTPEKLFFCELPPSLLSSCFPVLDAHTPIAFSASVSLSLSACVSHYPNRLCFLALQERSFPQDRLLIIKPQEQQVCMTQLKEKLSTTPIAISPPLMILLPASSSSSSPLKTTTEPIDKTRILDKTTTTVVQFLTLCWFSPQLLLPPQQLRISIQNSGLRISEV